jgi:hypothetical protein
MKKASLIAPLLTGGLSLVLAGAYADEIPFFLTNNASTEMCIDCTGPWLRDSALGPVPKGAQHFHFYSAEINIFPPFGQWTCFIQQPLNGSCVFTGAPVNFSQVELCADNRPAITTDGVELVGTDSQLISVNNEPPPCDSADAAAFLGDTQVGHLDRDGFRFDGKAGEQVTVRIERDGARGNTGKIARLSVRQEHGGMLDQRKGALPLELTVTLPRTGRYVSDATEVADHAAFRGYYRLKVISSNSKMALELEPLRSTEP